MFFDLRSSCQFLHVLSLLTCIIYTSITFPEIWRIFSRQIFIHYNNDFRIWIVITLAHQRRHAEAANSSCSHEKPRHELSTQTIDAQERYKCGRHFYGTRYCQTDPDVWVEASEVVHQCVKCHNLAQPRNQKSNCENVMCVYI